MTTFDQQLLAHLRLDGLTAGKATDSSAYARHGTVTGRPTVVADDQFGASLRFGGGDTVTVASVPPKATGVNPVHSITGWVYLDAYPARRVWLLTFGQAGAGTHHWLVNTDGGLQLGVWGGPQFAPKLTRGRWVHLATVYDGTSLSCYVDGQPAGKALTAKFNYTAFPLGVSQPQPGELGLTGRLSSIRVYERALSAAEVGQVIDDDRSAMAAFRRSHPLAFTLHDADDQPVLAIVDDPTGATMQLEVTNTASQTVTFAALPAGTDGGHLELRLRPGVVASAAKAPLAVTAPDFWTAKTATAADGTLRVVLTAKTGQQLKAGEAVRFTLRNIGADGRGGTRGTRVQLRYDQLTYLAETSLLNGRRLQHLSLVNRRGQEHVPLEVDFVGFNTVLTGSGPSGNLWLRITNVSRKPIPLTPNTQEGMSAFVLAFDRQPAIGKENDWAMGTAGELTKISVNAGTWTVGNATEEGQTVTWRLTSNQIALAAGDSVHITLGGVVARPPSGHARLLVHHENLPGYWDGHTALTIQKGPIVYRDAKLDNGTVEPRVGIGTADPQARLHLVHTNQDAGGNALVIGPTTQSHLRLGYHADYSWVQSAGNKPLLLNPKGNAVGVGATDLQGHKLFVNGSAKVLGLSVNSGTKFGRVQAGHFHAGPHTSGIKEVRVNFPEAFGAVPQAVVTVRNEGYYTDTFAFTVKYIDQTHFKVNLLRLDALNAGWQQDLRLDWIAWE